MIVVAVVVCHKSNIDYYNYRYVVNVAVNRDHTVWHTHCQSILAPVNADRSVRLRFALVAFQFSF